MNKKLISKVIEQLGYEELNDECKETLRDISRHGIDGGYGDFIYYADTVKFFNDNRDMILEHAQQLASDLGEDMLTMIASFNCLKGQDLTATKIMNAIYGDTDDSAQVKNAMAWFAGKEVAHYITND